VTTAGGDAPVEFLAVGDLGVDSVARIDRFPAADEKIWIEPAGDFSGGMMGNASAAAATLGVRSGVVALLGSDARGDVVLEGLHARGVDTSGVRRIDAPSFWALSLTVPSGERCLIQFPTPAFGGDWEGFDRRGLAGVRWVHSIAEEGDPVASFLADAKAAGAVTSLDIEYPFVLEETMPRLLADVDVAFLNSGAASALGGPEPAVRFVHDRGVTTVLVTLGRDGALLSHAGTTRTFPVWEVDAVDTNGAGDAFAGAYAAGILKGFTAVEAAELAVFYAGLSTTAPGGHGPALTRDEIRLAARARRVAWWGRL
jgi:ribokinase